MARDDITTGSGTTGEHGGKAMPHVDRGFECIGERKLEEAIAYFDEAITADPDCARAYYGRGLARHLGGDPDEAISDYDRAIHLDPRLNGAFLNRGSLRLQRGETEEAIADYERAIHLDPNDPHGYAFRAQARLEQKEHEKALSDLNEAIRLAPGNARHHYLKGLAEQQLGHKEQALKAMNEAIRLDPRMAEAFRARGLLLQELGEHDDARESLEQASHLDRPSSMTTRVEKPRDIYRMVRDHFAPVSTDDITITERQFPFRVRADLQRAIDRLFTESTKVVHFCGVKQHFAHEGIEFSSLIAPNPHSPVVSVPPQYDEIDIGEEQPIRCLQIGLWLLQEGSHKFAVLFGPAGRQNFMAGLKFQIATSNSENGTRIMREFFKHLEDSVLRSESYRGKILSFEMNHRYSGRTSGLLVHRLRGVSRDDVILPRKTLDLLDRNVIDFIRHRSKLARYGLSTKKGLLFYGPPGTGKTHTIHYLAGALDGHTTFLISAEQVGLLGEYMTLARLLQPSVVVMEDVDLIARDREGMDTCEEVLLNKLLNEMDGLRPDADVLFILTTNRPESLERALASRPGRVDQAIEFPLPDNEGREKLIRLYSQGLSVPDDVIRETVKKTERVSASFIKELMRRAAQFQIERGAETPDIEQADIDCALDELLFSGGSLNRKLLGAEIEDRP
jgi:cell division protease FtsH